MKIRFFEELRPRISRLYHSSKALPESTILLVQSSVYALAAALTAVLFLTLTNLLFRATFGNFVHLALPWFLFWSFVTIMGTSVLVGFLIDKVSPEAVGSGIPQLKAAYWKDLGYIPLKQAVVKFAAGILSIGGGASLGREGPTLFMGGSIASSIAGFFRVPRFSRRSPAIVGAAAGLAAAFNTPLASITFVLEEIVGDINSRTIGRIVLASVIGAFVVYAFIGRQPAFTVPNIDQVTWIHYFIVPLAALLAALVGVAFQRGALSLRMKWRQQKRVSRFWSPSVAALFTWVLGVTGYLLTGKLGVFSLGYEDLSQVLNGHFLW
ncbi:MAG: chloride channel protein, partial [Spirochaetales bacterium]|nr:chloride channel protein [Spirochaetales bacterium]